MKDAPAPANSFKVLEVKKDERIAIIGLSEDRMFAVPIPDGLEVKKGGHVALSRPELDDLGVPSADAAVAKVIDPPK